MCLPTATQWNTVCRSDTTHKDLKGLVSLFVQGHGSTVNLPRAESSATLLRPRLIWPERPSPIPEREIHVGWGSENSVLTHQESDSLSDNAVMCVGRWIQVCQRRLTVARSMSSDRASVGSVVRHASNVLWLPWNLVGSLCGQPRWLLRFPVERDAG